ENRTMVKKKSWLILFFVVALSPPLVFAQDGDFAFLFSKGFTLFKQGSFLESAKAFGALVEKGGEGDLVSDASYMELLSLVNAGKLEDAGILAESFLIRYPGDSHIPEVKYQNARIAFLSENFGKALELFSLFMDEYPENQSYSIALFWHSEALYRLGRLGEAQNGFLRFLGNFPASAMREAAEWRLEVMGLEAREAKLQRLLDFNINESITRQSDTEATERYFEHMLMRDFMIIRSLRSKYSFGGDNALQPGAETLAAEEKPQPVLAPLPPPPPPPQPAAPAPEPALPVVQPAPPSATAVELAKLNRLKELLDAKSRVLGILAQKLEQYATEVSQ
ncbi:MAG TPA: tetratricopeptide repeat protein, partial [Rectinemataceae bacterium]|nr:tetratricopeptide repeat protein [Rectinemataceae bacterium]